MKQFFPLVLLDCSILPKNMSFNFLGFLSPPPFSRLNTSHKMKSCYSVYDTIFFWLFSILQCV